MELLFINKVTSEREAFAEKVKTISAKLGIVPDALMFVMNWETGGTFSPSVQNPDTNATGLIQFMPSTALSLGTSTDALKNMTAVEQLDYVYEYLKDHKGDMYDVYDVYLAVFYPRALKENDDYVLGSERSIAYSQQVAQQNSGFDLNSDRQITKGEFIKWFDKKIYDLVPTAYYDILKKKELFCKSIKEKSFSGAELSPC